MEMFGAGSRELQDKYGGRAVADAITNYARKTEFDDAYRDFVESSSYFFLATSSGTNTDCSFKGGPKGFVKIVGPDRLIFPDYDGNRMYKSLGNIIDNPNVGMLFIRFDAQESTQLDANGSEQFFRVRINGTASLHDSHPAMSEYPGAKRIIEVQTKHIYRNCPRYIPRMEMVNESIYIPRAGRKAPEPLWKGRPGLKEALDGSE